MKRRVSQDVWVILGLLLLLIVASFFVGGDKDEEGGSPLMPHHSTYYAKRAGLKALYTTLRRLNYHVERNIDPLTSPPPDGTLFIIGPESPVSRSEWRTLRGWLKRGNTLIVAPEIGIESISTDAVETDQSSAKCPSFLSPDVSAFVVPKDRFISDDYWAPEDSVPSVHTIRLKKQAKPKSPNASALPLVPLFATSTGPSVSVCRCGAGVVVMLASAWSVSNDGIGHGDNLALILNALKHSDPGRELTVTFDEYHHGYGASKGIWSLISRPARFGIGQLLLAFLILAYGISRRFARPIPLREGARQRNEYLGSMASLLRRAHAIHAVERELRRRFTEDIAALMGLPVTADVASIMAVASVRYPKKSAELSRLLAPLAEGTKLDDAALTALTGSRYEIRKELMKKR